MRFLSHFVDSNDRGPDGSSPVDQTNELEPEIAALSDEEIRDRIDLIRDEIHESAAPERADRRRAPPTRPRAPRELTKARRKRDEAASRRSWTT